MVAVCALAPMLFKVVGASTYIFLAIFLPKDFQREKIKFKHSIFLQKMNPSTLAIKFKTGAMTDRRFLSSSDETRLKKTLVREHELLVFKIRSLYLDRLI